MEPQELKNIIFKMMNSLGGHKSRLDPKEESKLDTLWYSRD